MERFTKYVLFLLTLLTGNAWAQKVDRSKYPDYSSKINPDAQLMRSKGVQPKATETRPDHWNNGESRFFPPVFNQAGGSCGSASRICYMFTHELNSYRNLDGKDANNYYPSHFVWLLTNGNSGKDDFVQFVGVPSAATYGGQTYSKLFGEQIESQDNFGWMTGYDKWYSAMFNRMLQPTHFPESVETESGREAVKNWLWNHCGDTDFHGGGIVGLGVAGSSNFGDIASTPANKEAGVVGKYYLKSWGTTVDHAMTLVGYDDRIEFDLNGNGIYGEASADEKGAWILVNSWGDGWGNDGFIYVPYAYGGPTSRADGTFSGGFWQPEIYRVRKNYRPLRTIKIRMDYSRRSELYLMAGVASSADATEPEYTQAFDHFKYAGDGHNGNTNPAPEIPMLGRWADGKLHTEPMEFGYDLTDLSDKVDQNNDVKYFFLIETKGTAIGEGHIYEASIIDYLQDELGLEVPFGIDEAKGVTIENQGKRTMISVVVPGRGVKAPRNVSIADGSLQWTVPTASALKLTGYKVWAGSTEVATLDANTTSYALPTDATGTYAVQALYEGGKESSQVSATVPITAARACLQLRYSGFTIPGVFSTKHDKATIEFWIKPLSLSDWNQSAGPGWGKFMFHANADGTFTAGWGLGNDRLNAAAALQTNQWSHIALVVDGSTMTAYVNGTKKASITSSSYSGLGGWGDLVFEGGSNNTTNQNACYQELRIWKKARTADEIKADLLTRYADGLLPADLMAYYKGDFMTFADGTTRLYDHTAGQHHATLSNSNYKNLGGMGKSLEYVTNTEISIAQPTEAVVAGQPITLTAQGSTNIKSLKWTAKGAGISDLCISSPTLTFPQVGEEEVSVVAIDTKNAEHTATLKLNVVEAPLPDATFKQSKQSVATGSRVTFMANEQKEGYQYEWTLEGANLTTANTPYVTVSYPSAGTYPVVLTITDAQGHKANHTQNVSIAAVAPQAAFDVEPAIVMKGERVSLTDQSLYDPTHCQWTLVSSQNAIQGEGGRISFTPTTPGIYNVTLKATNEAGSGETTQSNALVVCNADSKTGLSFSASSSNTATVTTSQLPLAVGAQSFSIDWWMRPTSLSSPSLGIGENRGTFQLVTYANGQMRLYLSGSYAKSAEGFVVANEWHHYAVTFYMGYVCFYRDGELVSRSSCKNTSLPTFTSFSLGSSDAPMTGMVDEFRVWNNAFSENNTATLHSYITAPMDAAAVASAENAGLQLYYQFNQSSGNVQDATSHQNTGLRAGFGPDGDAWSDSRGVFALNFEGGATDVTEQYLTNYKAPFENTGNLFCTSVDNRFWELKDWTLQNINTTKYPTGAHADLQKGNYLTITTGNYGFESNLTDHMVYQTVDLPAGAYVLTAHYGDYDGQADGCYLVAAKGNELPTTANVVNEALAAKAMDSKGTANTNSAFFVLTEQTTVSLGILANMAGQQCLSIESFSLATLPISPMEGYVDGVEELPTPASLNRSNTIYDLSGRRIRIPGKGVYIIGGRKVMK